MNVRRAAVAAGLGTLAEQGAFRVLRSRPPGGEQRWQRTNYAGRPVSLLGGAAVACACTIAPVLGALPRHGQSVGPAVGAALVAATGGTMGALDDFGEDTASASKGLRGHLGALARGQVTTGALKIAGIGAGAFVAAVLLTPRSGSRPVDAVELVAGTVLVAGTANLHNLFDLRPGRALKVAAGVSAALAVGGGRTRTAAVVTTAARGATA
ncbi:hypothetical protein PU560_01735, partial [Georgenia sp. 10Sc9-8]|nr:hypothetical protein [Georgenia halotolerans]